MRMWMIEPKLLCRKHLLGEHGEIHKFRHNFAKQHKMYGYSGIIEPHKMEERHDQLAIEMLNRGYNHKSPYKQPDTSYLVGMDNVDLDESLKELCRRCEDCKQRIEGE